MAAESIASPVLRGLLVAAIAPALYVLSIGPVLRFVGADSYSKGYYWSHVAYRPLYGIGHHCKPAGVALRRYIDLWRR